MASSSEEVLEAAVAGIPEVARIISSLPLEDRASALAMAERSYLRTAKNLGGADDLAQKWASAVMYQLREQVEERVLARRKVLTALWEELAATPAQAEATKEAQKAGIAHARANDNGTKFRGRKPTFTWDTLVIVQDLLN